MVLDKIEYICKKCGWRKSILAVWADAKPKKCMNKKCNCSFILDPDSLGVRELAPSQSVEEPAKERIAEDQPKRNNFHRKGR